ncbi:hypothetical protein [Lacipirellula limnantheis]|nr:hypothetical protein [Lacipirellula limnantheis]
MRSWRRCLIALALLAMAAGCSGSRWAKEDRDYAQKYPRHTDDVAKVAKQAIDARHVIGKRGAYVGFAGSDEPAGAGAEAGLFVYPRSWLEARIGGAVLAHQGEHELSGGGIVGARVQTPTRLAPFAGVNGYVGYAGSRSADKDGVDNNSDGVVDEFGEDEVNFVEAIAPELGVHYWLTSRVRLTGSADYRLTSDGRGNDSLFYGVSLAVLAKGQKSPPKSGPADEGGWAFVPEESQTAADSSALPVTLQPTVLPPTHHQTTIPELSLEDVASESAAILNQL